MGEKPVTSFSQITSNVQLQKELQQIYGSVNNVELFVGLMAENHLPGSSLGQTEQAILAKQFEKLRDGDRYFYENADPPGAGQPTEQHDAGANHRAEHRHHEFAAERVLLLRQYRRQRRGQHHERQPRPCSNFPIAASRRDGRIDPIRRRRRGDHDR